LPGYCPGFGDETSTSTIQEHVHVLVIPARARPVTFRVYRAYRPAASSTILPINWSCSTPALAAARANSPDFSR